MLLTNLRIILSKNKKKYKGLLEPTWNSLQGSGQKKEGCPITENLHTFNGAIREQHDSMTEGSFYFETGHLRVR